MNQREDRIGKSKEDELGFRLVLAGMEITRLQETVEGLKAENEKQKIASRENELLKTRVSVLENNVKVKAEAAEQSAMFYKENCSLKEEIRKKCEIISRIESEKKMLELFKENKEGSLGVQSEIMTQLELLRKENSELIIENSGLKVQTEELGKIRREKSSLERQLDDLKMAKSEVKFEGELSKDLNHRVKALESDNDTLRSRISEMLERENNHINRQETIVALEDRLRSLLNNFEDCQNNLEEMSIQNEHLKKQASKLPHYEESIKKLIEENTRVTEVLTEIRAKAKADNTAEVLRINNSLKLEVESLKQELDRSKSELKVNAERIKNLSSHCNLKSAEASQLEVILTENERLAATITDLSSELSSCKRERSDLINKVQVLEANLKTYQASAKEVQKQMEDQIGSLNQQLKHLSLINENLTKDSRSLNERTKEIIDFEDKLRKNTADSESLRRVNDDLKLHNASLTEQLGLARKDLAAKSSAINQFRLVEEEKKSLEQLNEGLELKLKTLLTQITQKNLEIEALKEEIHKAGTQTQEYNTLKLELSRYRNLYLDAEEKLKLIGELETKLEIVQSQNKGLQDTNNGLRRELLSKESSLPHHKESAILTIEESSKLRMMVQELEVEVTLLREREALLKSQVNMLTGKVRCLDDTESELNRLKEENARILLMKEEACYDVKRLRSDLVKEREKGDRDMIDAEDKKLLRMELDSKNQVIEELRSHLGQQETERLKLVTELRGKNFELASQNEKLAESLSIEQSVASRQRRELDELKDKVALLDKLSNKSDKHLADALERESEIADLKRKLEFLEAEKCTSGRRYESHLQEIRENYSKATSEIELLRNELKNKEAKIELLSEENRILKPSEAGKRHLEEDYKKLLAKNSELQSSLSVFHDTKVNNQELKSKVHSLEADSESLRKRISEMVELMDELRNLNIDLEMKNKNIPKLEGKLILLEDQLREKNSLIEELVAQKANMMAATNDKLVSERESEALLELELNETKSQKSKLEAQSASMKLEIETLRSEKNRLQQELKMSEDYLTEIKKQSKENQRLISEKQSLLTQKEETALKLMGCEQEISIYREKLGEALIELEKLPMLEADLKQKKKEISSLEGRIRQLVSESDDAMHKMKERESELVQLHSKSEMNRQTLSEINIQNMQVEVKTLEKDRVKWRTQAENLEITLGQFQKEFERRISHLESEKAMLLKQIHESRTTKKDHDSEVTGLLHELEGYRRKVEHLEFKLNESYSKIGNIQGAFEENKLQVGMMAAKFENSENGLQREIKRLAESLNKANLEISRLLSLSDRQAEDLKNKSADVAALRQKLAMMTSRS